MEEYVDRGVSGAKTSRPELNRLMRDALKGLRDFDAVLVWKLDRFGRNAEHVMDCVKELREAGIEFMSFKEGFNHATPVGRLMFRIAASMAEMEHDITSERIKAGMKIALAKGNKPGPKIIGQPSRTTLWRMRKRSRETELL